MEDTGKDIYLEDILDGKVEFVDPTSPQARAIAQTIQGHPIFEDIDTTIVVGTDTDTSFEFDDSEYVYRMYVKMIRKAQ
jgi:hypothetical protein